MGLLNISVLVKNKLSYFYFMINVSYNWPHVSLLTVACLLINIFDTADP